MTDTENKILKLLETLVEGQAHINKRLDNHDKRFDGYDKKFNRYDKRFDEQDKKLDSHSRDMAHIITAIEALVTKQDLEIAIETAKAEIQATILDQVAKLTKILHKHDTRLENLEKHSGITNPTRN